METINNRFKKLRESCNKTQTEWGEILGIKTSGVSDIENGRRNVTEKHLLMLSNWKERPVNIEWLRTGKGERFVQIPEKDETADMVYDLLGPGRNEFYEIIIDIMRTYKKLSPDAQKTLSEFASNLRENMQKKNED